MFNEATFQEILLYWVKFCIFLHGIIYAIFKSSVQQTFFSIVTHFIIAYRISQVNVQTNYCNNNLLILDVKQLNNIMKLYYFNALRALWDGQGKIKMYYWMSRVKKQLSGKRNIVINLSTFDEVA